MNLEAAKAVTGVDIPTKVGPRRAGDPAQLYADASTVERELGWRAKTTDVRAIIETAWRWFRAHPAGYGSGG